MSVRHCDFALRGTILAPWPSASPTHPPPYAPPCPPSPPAALSFCPQAAEACSTEECPVKMKLVAPPLYVLSTNVLDKNKGIEVLTVGE